MKKNKIDLNWMMTVDTSQGPTSNFDNFPIWKFLLEEPLYQNNEQYQEFLNLNPDTEDFLKRMSKTFTLKQQFADNLRFGDACSFNAFESQNEMGKATLKWILRYFNNYKLVLIGRDFSDSSETVYSFVSFETDQYLRMYRLINI